MGETEREKKEYENEWVGASMTKVARSHLLKFLSLANTATLEIRHLTQEALGDI